MNLLLLLFGFPMKKNYSPVNIDFSQYKENKDIISKDTRTSSGLDERFKNKTFEFEDEELHNFKINYNKYKLLKKLESNDTSIFEKIDLIEKYDILDSNNKFEDLLKNWEFNI